jgi:RNA polymerase-binding transcription factor DksA
MNKKKTNHSGHWDAEALKNIARDSEEWHRFVNWQRDRIVESLQRYNNTETVKTQLTERGDLTPYQQYKITVVSKYLLQALELIKSGNYGICTNCRKQIPVQRLLLVPGALRCMDCGNK